VSAGHSAFQALHPKPSTGDSTMVDRPPLLLFFPLRASLFFSFFFAALKRIEKPSLRSRRVRITLVE